MSPVDSGKHKQMQRPANLVLPASDARTRLKQRTKIHGRTPDFVPTIRKKIFRYSEDKTSAQTIIEFLQNLPSNQDFPTVGSFLNELSKLLQNVDDPKDAALNELVIKTCLPWTNFDEPQIRALTFRLIRHSFHRRSQLQSLLLVQLELAVIRSLDLSDFEKEKEEAFKLLCRMIFFYKDSPVQSFSKFEDSSFTLFPMSTIKCLVALLSEKLPNPEGKPELSKPGKLFLPSLAILVDLAITDPNLIFKCAGTSWIVKSISELGSNSSNIAALICRLILKWMDTVEMREKASLHLVIEQIFAPLIDFGFFYQRAGEVKQDDFPQVEVTRILESVSTMLLSIIRSWTGIFVCGAINEHGEIISCSPLKLLGFLGFGTAFNPAMVKIRDMVISICCEFVDLPYATKPFANWSDAVVFYSKMYTPDKYKTSLRDDFVVGEMEILQNSGVLKPDVVDCLMTFRAVASYVLINAGLPQALARLIMARPDDPISIRATLLLADLLRSGASFLPEERKIMLLSTPSLIQAVSERLQISGKGSRGIHLLDPPTFPNTDNAMILFHRIDQLNDIAFNRLPIQTQLTNIEIFVKGGDDFSKAAEVRERSMSLLEPDERFDKLVQVESEFFSKTSAKELDLKDLESIIYFLEAENGVLIRKHRHNDKMHTFFSKIFTIILPANERFVTDAGSFNGKIIKSLCRAIKLLMPMAKTEPHYGELIERFLAQFKEQLDPVILYKGTFSPKNILNTGAHYYFAILAAIGSTLNGRQFIEESGILQIFLDLLLSTTSLEYVKLIISSLNYSVHGFTRSLLQTALTATDDQCRKWCTRFLGVLAGSDSIPDFGEFGMKLMISQLGDRSTKVVRHALRLLHFWLPKYPQSLPFLARTALEPLGSAGVLLKSHLFGSEKLVQAMKEETKELVEYWMNGYLVEYVRIIEEDMRMALLNVRRTIDGTYARSSNERFEKFGVPMPIHLFGQLSSHSFGRSLLADLSIPIRLLKTLQEKAIEKDDEILEVKAALLATGHIAANLPMGFIEVLMPPEAVPILCRFAEECPTLSIRGTAIWALSLVGKSEDGARLLASLGWESNRFIHIVDEVCDEFSEGLLSKSVARRSRTKSNCRTVWSDSESRKKLSTLKAKSVDDFGLPEWKKHYLPQKLPAKIRRANSEAQIVLPVLMNKKPGEKLSTIKVSPSNPEDVRPDRTFTQESAVTSGFGSAPHEEEKTANNSESSFLPPSLAKFHHRHYLPENKPYKTDKKEFPFAPSLLPDLIEPSTFSNFFNDDFDASIGSNYYSTGELPELNREKFDLSEVTNYPHFSSVYRRQHGIHGFEQENLLKIPNRTHSSVLYSFFSRSELKNVEKFEKLLNSVGEWIPGDVPRGGRKIVGCVGWTVVSLPSQIALICKNIFKNERNLATNRQISIRTNSSAQRCLFCLQKIAKGLPTNHFNSIDPRLRKDVLNFVSFFEIRGSSLQKLLSKKYGNKLQTAFENPCVYSDAVELLSVLNHNRKSRKEIQNLFSCAAKCAINIYG